MAKQIGYWILLVSIIFSSSAFAVDRVDKVYVEKSKRKLHLLHKQRIVRTYDISLGRQPIGHKQYRGDSRTPEGRYNIDYRNPKSRFTLSLHISYPNSQDTNRARAKGRSPGGDIFIHGLPKGMKEYDFFYGRDWTDGCIAVSNKAIKEIWHLVSNGTPIEIAP